MRRKEDTGGSTPPLAGRGAVLRGVIAHPLGVEAERGVEKTV